MSPVLLLLGTALAADVHGEVGGNLKLFQVAIFPRDDDLFAPEVQDPAAFAALDFPLAEDAVRAPASTSGILTSRLVAGLDWGPATFELHPQLVVQPAQASSGLTLTQTGTGTPQAVDLTWEIVDDDFTLVQLRVDRLAASVEAGPVKATVGRQAITFGHGLFFTPMDLVNPFFPTSIDQEYKPGVDAARVEAFWGTAGQAAVASAFQGDWDREGTTHAAYAQTGLGLWDVGGFAGLVRGDPVVGLSTGGSAGPVGLHADATLTLPRDDGPAAEDPFVRAVVGADGQLSPKTTLMGEVYVQTNGATDPAEYVEAYSDARHQRGELWLAGRSYAGLSVAQELRPVLSGSLFAIVNLEDPSALVGPSLAWSVSDEVSASLGAYAGVGDRAPAYQVEDWADAEDALSALVEAAQDPLRSEFGTMPVAAFATLQAWF